MDEARARFPRLLRFLKERASGLTRSLGPNSPAGKAASALGLAALIATGAPNPALADGTLILIGGKPPVAPAPKYTLQEQARFTLGAQKASAAAPSAYSRLLSELEGEYASLGGKRIVVIDPDTVLTAAGIAASANNGPLSMRADLFAHLKSRHVMAVPKDIDVLLNLMEQRAGLAVPSVETESWSGLSGKNVCFVFPLDADRSGLADAAALAALPPAALTRFGGKSAFEAFPKELMIRFAVYHEAGHCLDEVYVPASRKTRGLESSALSVKSDSFADVYGVLMLARDGVTDAADKLAALRLLAPAVRGRALSRYCDVSPASAMDISRRAMSHFSEPALMEAQRFITSAGREKLAAMSHEQILAKAREITDATALSADDLATLRAYLLGGEDIIAQLAAKPEEVRRHALVKDFASRADAAVAAHTDSTKLFAYAQPGDDAAAGYENFIHSSKSDMPGFAKGYAAFRDEARALLYSDPAAGPGQAALLAEIQKRLLTGDDLAHALLSGTALPEHARPLASAKPQPVKTPEFCAPRKADFARLKRAVEEAPNPGDASKSPGGK
jgi:hypothetical protein